ncbi:TRAP transporter small permease [Pseudorhodoplanes sp.]|jgi:TRAP-type C4-dicarboxylate transport system permease small subunit|uniref:TRAP transporter small permease n=1 Tax=Pseudorhodoplanes sp. TaxID=1934341 RepID=UPI002CE47058|nr:TRAP transporter small permease [Pseudorhodoplanes sp.]HWV43160.1 TRAP transporter small permease [Pseudorhodoplanes sp.]
MTRLSDLYGKFLDGLAVIAALLLLAMVLIVTGDIILRNVANVGFVWANEVSEYALYLITVLTAPWLLRRGQHVRLDLVLTAVPKRAALILEGIGDILGFVVCLAMIRYATLMTYDAWRIGSITIKNLVFPEWWLLVPLPVCFVLLAIEFVFRFHRLILNREKREEATSVA